MKGNVSLLSTLKFHRLKFNFSWPWTLELMIQNYGGEGTILRYFKKTVKNEIYDQRLKEPVENFKILFWTTPWYTVQHHAKLQISSSNRSWDETVKKKKQNLDRFRISNCYYILTFFISTKNTFKYSTWIIKPSVKLELQHSYLNMWVLFVYPYRLDLFFQINNAETSILLFYRCHFYHICCQSLSPLLVFRSLKR